MKRNIARIKVDDKSLLKISCSANRDYIFSVPRLEIEKNYCETHFTFHTQNNRVTFKVTDMGTEKTPFEDLKKEAEEKKFYVSGKDVDIYKKTIINDTSLIRNLNYLFSFSLIDIRDGFIKKIFHNPKTPDSKFPRIFQLNPPEKFNSVKIDVFISKNLKDNPVYILRSHKVTYNEIFLINDGIDADFYLFTMIATYSYQVKKEKG